MKIVLELLINALLAVSLTACTPCNNPHPVQDRGGLEENILAAQSIPSPVFTLAPISTPALVPITVTPPRVYYQDLQILQKFPLRSKILPATNTTTFTQSFTTQTITTVTIPGPTLTPKPTPNPTKTPKPSPTPKPVKTFKPKETPRVHATPKSQVKSYLATIYYATSFRCVPCEDLREFIERNHATNRISFDGSEKMWFTQKVKGKTKRTQIDVPSFPYVKYSDGTHDSGAKLRKWIQSGN